MSIYERIFKRLEELHMSQVELSRRTGIATSTISDWRKKKINPQADKLMSICKALDMSVVDLLCDDDKRNNVNLFVDYGIDDYMIEKICVSPIEIRRKMIQYFELLCLEENQHDNSDKQRNVSVIQDDKGRNIVLINDKRFKGLSKSDWKKVENYLKGYIGEFYEIACCSEKIFIDTDFPDEYANSESRIALKGPRRVAKANAAQAIPELIQIAMPSNEIWQENKEKKHKRDALFGWYRYNVRFGIPVYDNEGELQRYNIFTAIMLVRHDRDGKKYLYDLTTIKKETNGPHESKTVR